MEEIEGTSHNNNGNIISSFGLKQYVDPPSSTGALVVNNMAQTRSENPNPFPVGLTKDTPSAVAVTSASASTSAPAAVAKASEYDAPLSPLPISYSVPLATEFASRQRGRVEPPPISNNNNNYWLKYSFPVGPSFTHHVLSVNAGEDVTMKIMTFYQPSCRAICILSAYGPISDVTLRQPMTSGGTLTFKGHFEIISLTGSFIPTESGGTRIRAGGMSVSLAGPDCRVFGGGLAGNLIAAGPVHVIVGSFLAGQEESQSQQNEQLKKQLFRERFGIPPQAQASNISVGGSAEDIKARYELYKPVGLQAPHMKMQTRERFGIPPTREASNISFGGSAEDRKATYGLYKPVLLQPQHLKKQTRARSGIPPTTEASNISFGGSAEDLKATYGLYKPVLLQPPHLKKQTRARSGIPPTTEASNILFGGLQDQWGSPSS